MELSALGLMPASDVPRNTMRWQTSAIVISGDFESQSHVKLSIISKTIFLLFLYQGPGQKDSHHGGGL
jgi:hypothetical protein